jgi:streptogramin lyase
MERANLRFALILAFALASVAAVAAPKAIPAASSGFLLVGTVKSVSGEAMGGVAVSAKGEGRTITTTVFTDEQGRYYFPPLEPCKYQVWAQADSFETARQDVDLSATRHQDFTLTPMKDYFRQLTGDQLLASLPDDTPDDRRLKRVFRNNCAGCHQPNYILQTPFDEAGWTAIINLMRSVNVYGVYGGPNGAPAPIIEYHKRELAAYLARVRGPGPSVMKLKLRPRPSGDAARVVFTEYDIPIDLSGAYAMDNGSDWSQGTPAGISGSRGVHDAQLDLNGNLWFAYSIPSPDRTYGRVDAKTGEVKFFKLPGKNGLAAGSHGMMRDQQGILWLTLRNSAPAEGIGGSLARVDPNSGEAEVFTTPKDMAGPSLTVDVDGKGYVWCTTSRGALRFDPKTHKFIEFKSVTLVDADGTGTSYGLAADREGNGWWAEMAIDIVGKSDIRSGKSLEIKLPPAETEMDLLTPGERELYETSGQDWNSTKPWAQGPRRMGADKNGDVVWVCDFWGGNLARIDIHTLKTTFVPLPSRDEQPYHAAVDGHHNVWINMMNEDRVMEYDPASSRWTGYDLPTLGAEARFISLGERDGKLQVVVPYFRSSKIALMTFRSPQDLQALKTQVEQGEQAEVR